MLALIVAIASCATVAASQTGGSQCKSADSTSVRIDTVLSNLLVGPDSGYMTMRDSIGIAGVQMSQVSLIADSRTCSRLASALDHLAGVSSSGRLIYAYSVGNTFAILDPTFLAGDYVQLVFFSSRFKFLLSMDAF